jgi:competence protein ComEC
VIANLLAMPVVSALAMPFGFDGVFWRIMELGIDWMVIVAQGVATLPGAVGRIASFGTGSLLLASLGLIVMALLRMPLRYAGGLLLVASVLWAMTTPQPDILIAADGRHVAVRAADGKLRRLQDGKDAFLLKEWLAADADGRALGDPSLSNGVSCDEAGCVAALADGRLVSLARLPEAVVEDCEKAAVLITRQPVPAVGAAADGAVPEQDTVVEPKPTRIPPRPVPPPRDATPPVDVGPEPD